MVRDRNGIKLFFTALSRHAIRCGYFKGGARGWNFACGFNKSAPCRRGSLGGYYRFNSLDIIVFNGAALREIVFIGSLDASSE